MIAEELYGDPTLDYIIILVAGIINVNHEWPLQDYQVYDFALEKYGSETEMNANHHYETFEIRDDKNRLILLLLHDQYPLLQTVVQRTFYCQEHNLDESLTHHMS